MTPQIQSAQVFAADGVTPAPGKGPLTAGTDFTLSLHRCTDLRLTLTALTPAAVIGPNQRLIVRYRTQLDPDSQHGATLTNIAGAVQWFNGSSSNANRQTYTEALTNGTVGMLDHEDAHTVTVALYGYFFEKRVANLTTGANPTTTASPGDRLRYTLRLQSTDVPLADLTCSDDLGALNASAVFAPGTLALVPGTLPPGADASNTNATAGTNGAGVLDVRDLSLPAFSEISLQFDVTLATAIPNGTIVANQADLMSSVKLADSDDPNVNGQADPNVIGDEDPTRVQITSAARFDVNKISTDSSGDPNLLLAGETLRYTITIKNIGTDNAVDALLRDQVPANTTYVAGSTRLNGTLVPDGAGGLAPLANGIAIYAPENPTPGVMRADSSATSSNVATIIFDVVVNASVGQRHRDLEPGLRERGRRGRDRSAVGRPRYADGRRPDARRGRHGAARVRAEIRGAPSRPRHGRRRRSRRRAALHDRDPQQRRARRHRRDVARRRAGQYHIRCRLDDFERPVGRPAGRRRGAARGRHPVQLRRSHAAAAGSGPGDVGGRSRAQSCSSICA